MLTFEELNTKNWKKYEHNIINSEQIFQDSIRTDLDEFLHILRTKYCVAKVALLDNQYIGFVVGYRPQLAELSFHGVSKLYKTNDFIYIFDLVIDPAFQGKGFGLALLEEFVKSVKDKGFTKIVGHFRPNSSVRLFHKLGGKTIKIVENWEGTGENFELCELNI